MTVQRCRVSNSTEKLLALCFCNGAVLGEPGEEMLDTSTIIQDKLECSLSCLWDNGLLMTTTDTELDKIKFSYS